MNIRKLIAVALMTVCCATTQAQNQQAFQHLGVGIEAGLMGFGGLLAMPIVNNHIVAVVGYNFYNVNVKSGTFNIDKDVINEGITKLNTKIDNDVADHPDHTDYRHAPMLDKDMEISPKVKFGSNVKVLFEFYPSKNSGFHFTAGMMIGCGNFLTVGASADKESQAIFKDAVYNQDVYNRYENGATYGQASYEDFIYDNLRFNLDDERTFLAYNHDTKELDAEIGLKLTKVKPYFGIGFGRSVPKKRVSFQFELGAWYHGKPEITSPNEVPYDRTSSEGITGVTKIMNKVQFFPQLTFRLNGRIF